MNKQLDLLCEKTCLAHKHITHTHTPVKHVRGAQAELQRLGWKGEGNDCAHINTHTHTQFLQICIHSFPWESCLSADEEQ